MTKSLEQLQEALSNKDLNQWEQILKQIENPSAEYVGNLFPTYFQTNDTIYFSFAQKAWLYFSSEDDRESLLWVWVEDVYRIDKSYGEFIIDLFLSIKDTNTLEGLVEYFFDLLGIYYKPKVIKDLQQLTLFQEFLKIFFQHPNIIISASAYVFSYQEQLIDKFPRELLERFNKFSEKMQESFIPLIFRHPMPEMYIQWVRKNIKNFLDNFSERILTSFIIHMLENIEEFKDLNDIIVQFLHAQTSSFLQESVLLYLLPVEIATKPDLQSYVEYFLNNSNTNIILMTLDNLLQFFDDWPVSLQNKVFPLIRSSEPKIRSAIIKLISPAWINEEIIIAGLHDKTLEVQETTILACITVFRYLKEELKTFIQNLLKSSDNNWKDYNALLLGYNFDYKDFYNECLVLLNENHGAISEKCVYALALRWNDLPEELRKILSNNINNWNEPLYQGLQAFSGVLDTEGTEILEYLSEKNAFIPLDDLTFKKED